MKISSKRHDDINRLRREFARIAVEAGRPIMSVYEGQIDIADKRDGSPTTAADSAAEAVILEALATVLPGVSVLAEEGASAGLPSLGDVFVAVDPLDGTREFINRNGEFTVNIALVENGVPTVGAVYAPALGRLWLGGGGEAWAGSIPTVQASLDAVELKPIRTRNQPEAGLTAVASRSHLDENTAAFLEGLPIASRRSIGSSLKFCLVAEGEADVYPRFGPTMEWDTAAGHAVVTAAGGRVVTPEGEPFLYGKTGSGYRNGSFVVWGR